MIIGRCRPKKYVHEKPKGQVSTRAKTFGGVENNKVYNFQKKDTWVAHKQHRSSETPKYNSESYQAIQNKLEAT